MHSMKYKMHYSCSVKAATVNLYVGNEGGPAAVLTTGWVLWRAEQELMSYVHFGHSTCVSKREKKVSAHFCN